MPRPLSATLALATLTASAAHAQTRDSVYATPALRALVADAARGNQLPPDLTAYKANVETEIAVAARYDEGAEAVVALEQIATTLRWTRTGYYDQHVVGYRVQQAGLSVSMLGNLRTGWASPTLYGNRLRVRRNESRGAATVARARRPATDTTPVVHPLADDRDAFYRYTGGDTVVTVRIGERTIPIVRIAVEPRMDQQRRVGLFHGEVELDASRHTLVRIRGYMRVAPTDNRLRARVARAAIDGYAFVEYVNSERAGRYWLPSYQRIDLQATSASLGDTRGVVHIVSRFRDYAINDTTLAPAELALADSLRRAYPRRLTRAPADTLERYAAWQRPLGQATGETHGDDFADVAPERWRPTGPPRAELAPQRGSDLFHYDRVEGAYTGVGGRVRFRDAAPGLTLRGAAGWAWAEGTARGRVELEQAIGRAEGGGAAAGGGGGFGGAPTLPQWTLLARAGRSLDLTNDFRLPLDSGSTVAALFFSLDDYDYVDRRFASLSAIRRFGARTAALRVDLGLGDDRGATASVTRGLFKGDSLFRPNRPVDPGRYVRSAVALELHPDVNGTFLTPGIGARVAYERGDGELDWQRLEGRVAVRRTWSPDLRGRLAGGAVVAAARVDGGILLASAPPRQQLFELGDETLYGYDYKQFAGDRAGIGRASVMFVSPWGRTPLRVLRAFTTPGWNPGVSVGVQTGWTEASDAAAARAVAGLAPGVRPTDGLRTSVVLGLRFFGGSVLVGAARPVDRRAAWKAVLSFAPAL